MRVLFLTAFYPPHAIGGWPFKVQELNERLLARGHATMVLTSNYGADGVTRERGIWRSLDLEADVYHYRPLAVVGYRHRLRRGMGEVAAAIEAFAPDVVFVHVMWNLAPRLAWQAERLCPGRVAYYIADHWPYVPDVHAAYWSDAARRPARRVLKRVLAPFALRWVGPGSRPALQFARALCVSRAMQGELLRRGLADPHRTKVVHYAVDTARFAPRARASSDALALLYAGSLVRHKGVHTVLQALALLAPRLRPGEVSLTIAGAGHPEYEDELREAVSKHGLAPFVRFAGAVPHAAMPRLLQDFDALVFPSLWEEPLAAAMLEAMSSGLLVIGTRTGGSGEILVEGETGLVFPPGDATVLAARIEEARSDRAAAARLAARARQVVVEHFDLTRMVNEIEGELADMVSGSATPP